MELYSCIAQVGGRTEGIEGRDVDCCGCDDAEYRCKYEGDKGEEEADEDDEKGEGGDDAKRLGNIRAIRITFSHCFLWLYTASRHLAPIIFDVSTKTRP